MCHAHVVFSDMQYLSLYTQYTLLAAFVDGLMGERVLSGISVMILPPTGILLINWSAKNMAWKKNMHVNQ